MSLQQISVKPASLPEMLEFWKGADLTKIQKRLIGSLTDESTDEERMEIYSDLYDDLPKPKASRKKVVKEMTPEEKAAMEKKRQKDMADYIGDYKKKMMEKAVFKEDGELDFPVNMKDYFSHLTPDEIKGITKDLSMIAKYVKAEIYQKALKSASPKSKATTDHTRKRTSDEIDGSEKVSWNKDGSDVKECVVVKYNEKRDKCGIDFDDQKYAIIHDLTKNADHGQHQIKKHPAARDTPIDKVVGCGCGVKWKFAERLFKKNEDGVWCKQDKADWGMIPCNMKVDGDSGKCKRHADPKFKADWKRSDLKIEEGMVYSSAD